MPPTGIYPPQGALAAYESVRLEGSATGRVVEPVRFDEAVRDGPMAWASLTDPGTVMHRASNYQGTNRGEEPRPGPQSEPEDPKDDFSRPPVLGAQWAPGESSGTMNLLTGPGSRGRDRAPPPENVLVYGDSRAMVNLVLYALAEDTTPRFHWLDIRPESESPAEWDPARMGWLKESHSWVADPRGGLSPDDTLGNAAIFELIRSDEPPEVLTRLTDLLRLPPMIRHIVEAISASGEPNLLAVANVDRVSAAIPEPALAPIVAAFAWLRCSLFVGYAASRAPRMEEFTTVLRIDGTSPYRWHEARVHFERGIAAEAPRTPEGVSCTELPFLRRVFQRAIR